MMPQNLFKESSFILIPKKSLALLGATYTAIALALVPIFVRLSEVGPIATAFYRFFLAFPFLLGWMIMDQARSPTFKGPSTYKDYLLILGAGAFLALDITFWHWAILRTTVVNATLLNNLTTIFVGLSSSLFLKEKLSYHMKIGMALAFAGALILMAYTFKVDVKNLGGDILALISALFFTAFILTIKELRRRFHSPAILAWGALPTFYILAFIAYWSGETFFPVTAQGWLPLLGMAFLVHILGQGMMTFSMAHLSASLVALIVGLSPAFASVFAWIMFDEALTFIQIIGASTVLLGIFIAKRNDTG